MLLLFEHSCPLHCRAKWNAYTEQQLLHGGQQPDQGYWEAYVQQVLAAQIEQFRPAVLEADPSGVFRLKYLDALLGIQRS